VLDIRNDVATGRERVLVLPVIPADPDAGDVPGSLLPTGLDLPTPVRAEAETFLGDVDHDGSAGAVHSLPRPGQKPRRILLVGVGQADEASWRAAGAAVVRAAAKETDITIAVPTEGGPAVVAARGLSEGLWLGAYRFGAKAREDGPQLRTVRLGFGGADGRDDPRDAAVTLARAIAEATILARDLTNTPGLEKSPDWFVKRVTRAARDLAHVELTVLGEAELAERGFGGILAVGGGSARPPRLLQLSYRPPGVRGHAVLVGKGITFDTGGISLKPLDGMRLMRKDMGGAAAVVAAALAVAKTHQRVRVTALAPLAENMVSGSAMRPGDVIRHFGGLTSEVQNTDAEGRLVLADALSYAVSTLRPDVIVDLATLTGASNVALGKRTAALFTPNEALADELTEAAAAAGERVWRMPLPDDYLPLLTSDVADLTNSPAGGMAGAVTAALYLREFVGDLADSWAHIDMSAPAWIETNEAELVKGATGWGVRTLVRWLTARAEASAG
jgi:leucyl aminopeptidase